MSSDLLDTTALTSTQPPSEPTCEPPPSDIGEVVYVTLMFGASLAGGANDDPSEVINTTWPYPGAPDPSAGGNSGVMPDDFRSVYEAASVPPEGA